MQNYCDFETNLFGVGKDGRFNPTEYRNFDC